VRLLARDSAVSHEHAPLAPLGGNLLFALGAQIGLEHIGALGASGAMSGVPNQVAQSLERIASALHLERLPQRASLD
jgi:hypothetical protein